MPYVIIKIEWGKYLLFVLILGTFYYSWSNWGRNHVFFQPELFLDKKPVSLSDTSCRPNVVLIQPFMLTTDYASEQQFFSKLNGYFSMAKENGMLNESTVVVLPEHIGSWLVVAGEKQAVIHARTIQAGMGLMAASNLFAFLKNYLQTPSVADRASYSLFKMKAAVMWEAYRNTFVRLADQYGVVVVAGSIFLPEIENNGRTKAGSPLFNMSFIFSPGKGVTGMVKKAFPTTSENAFIMRGDPIEIPVFDLPLGKTAVLVCADSWYPAVYDAVLTKGVDFIIVPSYINGDGTLRQRWKGYDGAPAPAGVDTLDIGRISEGEAWEKYALPGRIAITGARHGCNIFLRGKLWDLGSDGDSYFIKNGQKYVGESRSQAKIISQCFEAFR